MRLYWSSKVNSKFVHVTRCSADLKETKSHIFCPSILCSLCVCHSSCSHFLNGQSWLQTCISCNYVFLKGVDNAVDCWTLTSGKLVAQASWSEWVYTIWVWQNDWCTHKQSIGKRGLNGGLEEQCNLGLVCCKANLRAANWTVGSPSLNQPNENGYLQSLALEQWPSNRLFN